MRHTARARARACRMAHQLLAFVLVKWKFEDIRVLARWRARALANEGSTLY